MITVESITDAQIVEVLEDAQCRNWQQTVADCYVAMHGENAPTRPRQHQRRTKTSAGYYAARERVARRFNELTEAEDNGIAYTAEEMAEHGRIDENSIHWDGDATYGTKESR